MRNFFTLVALLMFFGCNDIVYDSSSSIVNPVVGNSSFQVSKSDTCPNIYEESIDTLNNGVIVTWTSSFGGYEYEKGTDYTVTVGWTVSGGSATFVGFTSRRLLWTPPIVRGSWSTNNQQASSIDLTVTMNPMHRSIGPDWRGYIGNAHFTLNLNVDGLLAKFGVNVHLEDPDDGNRNRCQEENKQPGAQEKNRMIGS